MPPRPQGRRPEPENNGVSATKKQLLPTFHLTLKLNSFILGQLFRYFLVLVDLVMDFSFPLVLVPSHLLSFPL